MKRTTSDHFTADEVAFIARCFKEGRKPASVAAELQCAVRTIQTRYVWLRNPDAKDEANERAHLKYVARVASERPMRPVIAIEPQAASLIERPLPEWIIPAVDGPITLANVRDGQCRWPRWADGARVLVVCGAACSPLESYCEVCKRIAYQPAHKRERAEAGA